jgi:hypothetical protein
MKRKDFLLSTLPAAAIIPEVINGYSVKALSADSPLVQALMRGQTLTDHVLVILMQEPISPYRKTGFFPLQV